MSGELEPHTKLLIGGEALAGAGAALSIENPFTTEPIVEVASASPEQVDAAVATAREAWPGWASTTAGERCELLHEVARRLREQLPDKKLRLIAMTGYGQAADKAAATAAGFDAHIVKPASADKIMRAIYGDKDTP